MWRAPTVIIVLLVCQLPWGKAQGDELTYTVREEQPRGTFVGDVARDSNVSSAVAGDDLTSIRYRILRQGTAPGSYFMVGNRSGVLTTAFKLDRENITICEFRRICKFNIYVALQSGQFFRTIVVNIYLEDVNDEVPRFPQPSINLYISESVSVGTSYTIDSAEDKDGGENHSIQSYEMIPRNSTFGLKVTKNLAGVDILRIVVNLPLDREMKSFYQRYIRARDGGPNPNVGELVVNITITDVNDNSPIFSKAEYHANVSEALSVDSHILTVRARDLDSGENGKVYYRLSPLQEVINKDIFKIDKFSGEITPRASLVSLQGRTVRLVVQAYDGGSDPGVTPIFVFINVLDTINNPPHAQLSVLNGDTSARVFEHSSVGFAVAHLIVSDGDTGENGRVNCSVISPKFQLQTLKVNEYKVVVSDELDREVTPLYNVTIACQDGGHPPLHASTSFTVILLDINDHAPVFKDSGYIVNITENNAKGEVLTQARATDLDYGENRRITFAISSSYSRLGEFLQINPSTGLVTASSELDRETFATLNVTITAFDNGKHPLSANTTLIINVMDLNDNAPKFTEAVYVFKILEDKPIDTPIGHVKANDPDLNAGGFVTYTLVDSGHFIPFILTGTGALLSNSVFDREEEPEYRFDVEAKDHGFPSLSSRVRVIVEIDDINDNHPVITYPNETNMTAKVAFQKPPGTQITVVKGDDNDTGINANLRFSMTPDASDKAGLFSIDGASGIIFVDKHLTEEEVGTYVVYISARDQGTPPLPSEERPLEIIVFVGNFTDPPTSMFTAGQNALIVITLLCLTVIIAAVILTVLLRIRRRDRQKKSDSDVTLNELPECPLPQSPIHGGGEYPNYKPVQVEDKGKDTNDGWSKEDNKHDLLMFKMQLAEQYKQKDHDEIQKSESPSRKERVPIQETRDKYDATDQQTTRLAALKYQQALVRGSKKGRSPQHSSRYGPKGETVTDDILSNSSGETTATDSGRGYSEEDSHSQGRSSLPSETDDSGLPGNRFDSIRDLKTSCGAPQRHSSSHRNSAPLLRQSENGKLILLQNDYRPRNVDSIKLRGSGPRKKPASAHFDRTPRENGFQKYVPKHLMHQQTRPRSSDYHLSFKKGLTGFSLDNLNDSIDDDNTTTTSGSYTIDHIEEAPDDIITFANSGLKDVYV